MTEQRVGQMTKPRRLLSIDILRGLTIGFMILVNNNGNNDLAYRAMNHSPWNGFTPTDLVFPTFLLIMGISVVLSDHTRRARNGSARTQVGHIVRRTALLFFLGLVVNGFPYFHLGTLRIYGVLQRIAVCYLAASLLLLLTRRAAVWITLSAALLIGYWWLLRYCPVPGHGLPGRDFPLLDRDLNIVAWVDRHIFPHRLFEGTRDPEGLLSDLPAIVSGFLGVLAGQWITGPQGDRRKVGGLLLGGIVLLLLGAWWGTSFPINKKLWTSSYVLFAAGWGLLATAAVYFLVEVRGWRGHGWQPFLVLGTNAITAYVLSELLSSAVADFPAHAQLSFQQWVYGRIFQPILNPAFGSLMYSAVFLAVCWVPVWILYRNRIFLKL